MKKRLERDQVYAFKFNGTSGRFPDSTRPKVLVCDETGCWLYDGLEAAEAEVATFSDKVGRRLRRAVDKYRSGDGGPNSVARATLPASGDYAFLDEITGESYVLSVDGRRVWGYTADDYRFSS